MIFYILFYKINNYFMKYYMINIKNHILKLGIYNKHCWYKNLNKKNKMFTLTNRLVILIITINTLTGWNLS